MYDQTEVEFLVNLIISTQKSEKSFSPYEYDYHSLNTTSQFPTASTALSSPVSSLKSFSNYRPRQKILICGLPDDISPCLDYAMIAKPGMIDYSSLIIASTDIDELIVNYFGKIKIHLVNWDETDYEEMLIERVRPRSDNFVIPLVIEFQPTIRRMKRIRELLEKNKFLVLIINTNRINTLLLKILITQRKLTVNTRMKYVFNYVMYWSLPYLFLFPH
ncbi:unnamed protein product [Schistosoma intercalatum]|nr:unnamed protein product [Schistosoma intercalatum]